MIGIRITFLAGRLHATPWGHHVNEGAVEFPPSPWRLLRALVATFHRARPEGVDEESLTRILAALASPPVFRLPPAATAHTRHYDQANGGVKFFDSFVALDPQAEVVWLWRDAELNEADRAALSSVLDALGTFGRAESWCEAELLDDATARDLSENGAGRAAEDAGREAWSQPLEAGESLAGREPVRVLAPGADNDEMMRGLLLDTATMRKGKRLDPPGSRWVTYTRPLDLLTPRGARPARSTC